VPPTPKPASRWAEAEGSCSSGWSLRVPCQQKFHQKEKKKKTVVARRNGSSVEEMGNTIATTVAAETTDDPAAAVRTPARNAKAGNFQRIDRNKKLLKVTI
jgi:hypothetical protein